MLTRFPLFAVLLLAACQSTAPPTEPRAAPGEQAAVEAQLDRLLAVAAAPETDGAAFRPFVAFQDADGSWRSPAPAETATAAARLAEVREVLDGVASEDGQPTYEVEEYVVEPADGVEWHVVRVAFGRAAEDSGPTTSQAEFAFVSSADGFLLLELLQ